jgi:hypothetical protein
MAEGYRPGHRQEGWDLRFDWGAEGLRAIAARDDLGGWLARSGSGRELASVGFDDDVAAAACLDADAVAPVLDGAAFSAVAAPTAGHLR